MYIDIPVYRGFLIIGRQGDCPYVYNPPIYRQGHLP